MRFSFVFLAAALWGFACDNVELNPDKTASREKTVTPKNSPVATCPPAGAPACPAETRASEDACIFDGPSGVNVTASIEDFDSRRPLPGAVVNVIDNESGEPVGICGVAGNDGTLSIKVPQAESLAFAVSYADAKDTYQFNLAFEGDASQVLFSVSKVTAQLIPALIGFLPDSTRGMALGTVLNRYASPVTESEAGLQVRAQTGQEAYYFVASGTALLPINHAAQPVLNPANAMFALFDLTPGMQQLELLYGGAVTATSASTLTAYPDSVSINNLICTHCEE